MPKGYHSVKRNNSPYMRKGDIPALKRHRNFDMAHMAIELNNAVKIRKGIRATPPAIKRRTFKGTELDNPWRFKMPVHKHDVPKILGGTGPN